jgi:hypothetical protein
MNRCSAAAAALFLGGRRIRSEIDFAGSIGLRCARAFILPGAAVPQKSTSNSEPMCLTIESSGCMPIVRSVPAICVNPCVRGFSSAAPSNGRIRIGSRSRSTKRRNRTIAGLTRSLELKFFTGLISTFHAGRLEGRCLQLPLHAQAECLSYLPLVAC